jgi:hypothetical protein
MQRAVTCIFIDDDGTSTFYSGPNGCGGTAEAQWIIGGMDRTQVVKALNGDHETVCGVEVDIGSRLFPATIESEVTNKP